MAEKKNKAEEEIPSKEDAVKIFDAALSPLFDRFREKINKIQQDPPQLLHIEGEARFSALPLPIIMQPFFSAKIRNIVLMSEKKQRCTARLCSPVPTALNVSKSLPTCTRIYLFLIREKPILMWIPCAN